MGRRRMYSTNMNVQNVSEENLVREEDERKSFILQDLIVGSNDCKISEVAAILKECLPPSEWSSLARQLDCSSNQIATWTLDLAASKYTYEDLYNKILEDWNSRKSKDAKLSTLLDIFDRKLNRKNIRVKLLEKFPISYKTLKKREKGKIVEPVVPPRTRRSTSDKIKYCLKFFGLLVTFLSLAALVITAIALINGNIIIKFINKQFQNVQIHTKCEFNVEESIVNRLGWLNITSSDEYDRLIPRDRYSRIYLKITHPSHWSPTEIKNKLKGCNIREIHVSGNYTLDTLLDVFNEFSNLETISIEGGSVFTKNVFHSNFGKPVWFPKRCPKLKTLILHLSESDLSILQILTDYVNLDTVEKLKLVVANVNNDNVIYIRRLLSETRMLKYLEILVHFKTVLALFEINTQLVYVEEIIFNIIDESYSYGNIPLYELGEHFYETFPNLSTFNSSSGALLYTARSQILQCKNLQSLQINFYHNTTSVISLGLHEKLPRLQCAKIWVEFDKSKCPHMSKLLGLNNEKIRNPGSNLKICSNSCPINAESLLGCIGAINNHESEEVSNKL